MTKAQDRALRSAFTRFDRATAYGCRVRNVAFDRPRMEALWAAYQALVAEACRPPEPPESALDAH